MGTNREPKHPPRDTERAAQNSIEARDPATEATAALAKMQAADLPELLTFLHDFWLSHASEGSKGRVVPSERSILIEALLAEPFPERPADLGALLGCVRELLARETVKTSHPLFLGYVTPPALHIAALGDALAAAVNQNVAFAMLSPLGTALEATVIRWLGQIVGYPSTCGGVLTSGGSSANLYGLAVARHRLLGSVTATDGNHADPRRLRIYCSAQTHHSIDKAAILLGLGTKSIKRIPVDDDHRIRVDLLRAAIQRDLNDRDVRPMAIVGNSGTRLCCAYDDLPALRKIADEYDLWLHVDAAYGGFLRLANARPHGADRVHVGDSIVLNPHKLLFVPFDCGSLLVRLPRHLSNCFGAEGEYIEMRPSAGLDDYANYGMQLGRSMKALKVWLALKRFGRETYAAEYTRLIGLAQHLVARIDDHPQLERLGPAGGTSVCFRWRGEGTLRDEQVDRLNSSVRQTIIRRGTAFVDEVVLQERTGFRLCMTNFRTASSDLDALLATICHLASSLQASGEWSHG